MLTCIVSCQRCRRFHFVFDFSSILHVDTCLPVDIFLCSGFSLLSKHDRSESIHYLDLLGNWDICLSFVSFCVFICLFILFCLFFLSRSFSLLLNSLCQAPKDQIEYAAADAWTAREVPISVNKTTPNRESNDREWRCKFSNSKIIKNQQIQIWIQIIQNNMQWLQLICCSFSCALADLPNRLDLTTYANMVGQLQTEIWQRLCSVDLHLDLSWCATSQLQSTNGFTFLEFQKNLLANGETFFSSWLIYQLLWNSTRCWRCPLRRGIRGRIVR